MSIVTELSTAEYSRVHYRSVPTWMWLWSCRFSWRNTWLRWSISCSTQDLWRREERKEEGEESRLEGSRAKLSKESVEERTIKGKAIIRLILAGGRMDEGRLLYYVENCFSAG